MKNIIISVSNEIATKQVTFIYVGGEGTGVLDMVSFRTSLNFIYNLPQLLML